MVSLKYGEGKLKTFDYYFVDNLVRDYGETRTDSSMVYASWMLTVWNQGSHREFTYATLRYWPLRVGQFEEVYK